ncbi:hypothetical protein M378DRAFT_157260, partial [Amanita muscaria Koide BX008]
MDSQLTYDPETCAWYIAPATRTLVKRGKVIDALTPHEHTRQVQSEAVMKIKPLYQIRQYMRHIYTPLT